MRRSLLPLLFLAAASIAGAASRASASELPPALELRGLELTRAPASAFTPWLDGDDIELERQAVRALGRVRDPAAAPLLDATLEDQDPGVRAEAALARSRYPDAAPPLLAALEGEDEPAVRAALLDALGRSGDEAAIGALLAALDSAEPTDAVAAGHALGRLGVLRVLTAPPDDVVTALLDQLSRFDLERRRAAAFALARTKPSELSDELSERLADATRAQPDTVARAWLVRAAASGLPDARWEPLAAELCDDSAMNVRVALARGLAGRGDVAASAALTPLLADGDRAVRVAALESAARLPWDPAWDNPMQAMLGIRDIELQARALPVMAAAGALAEPEGWLNPTVDSTIRAAMLSAVDDLELLASAAVDARALAGRPAAAEQLVIREPAVDRALLWPLLESPDPVVAGLVAQSLAEAPDDELIERLQQQLVERIDYDGLIGMITALSAALEASGVEPGPKPVALPGSLKAQAATRLAELQAQDDPAMRAEAHALGALMGLPPAGPAGFPRLLDETELDALLGARVQTSAGELILAFHTDDAPYAVQRWVELAEAGAYEGRRFHRVMPDFVVQGGCPRGDGYGGPGYALPDELSPLPYGAGSVGMASAGPDTAGSQWFVTLSPQPHLDGDYTLFAELVGGEDVLRRINQDDRIDAVIIERRAPSETSDRP